MNKQVLNPQNLIISRDMISKNKANQRSVRYDGSKPKQRVKSPSPLKRINSVKKIDKNTL